MKHKPKVLSDLPLGSRLLYRAKNDWRSAVVSKFDEKKATLIVCSPTGRTYRLRRDLDAELVLDGLFAILRANPDENWKENFADYDRRW